MWNNHEQTQKMIRPKYIIDDDALLYTHKHPKIMLHIQRPNKDGITWCQNCYRDDKPILVFGFDGLDLINLCEDCIGVLFGLWKENCVGRK